MGDMIFTIAGAVVGGAIAVASGGAAVGAGIAVGMAIGGLADAGVASLKSQNQKGPEVGDSFRVPGVDEGAGIPWLLGSSIRIPGQVIWVNVRKPRESGKVKSDGSSIDRYFVDVAIAWCGNRCNPDPVRKIWAANEVIYLGDDVPVVVVGASHHMKRLEDPPAKLIDITDPFAVISTPWCTSVLSGGDDREAWRLVGEGMALRFSVTSGTEDENLLNFLLEGLPITISGSVNPENDGEYDVTSITDHGIKGAFREYYFRLHRCRYSFDNAVDQCVPIDPGACIRVVNENGGGVTISQVIPGGWSPYFPDGTIATYNGDPDTDNLIPDPTIVGIEGAGNVSAHRGMCYTVITNLDTSKWAGTLPVFEGLIRERIFRNVKEVVEAVLDRSEGLSSNDYDTSALVNSPDIDGFMTIGPQSPGGLLQRLMTLYGIVAQQRVLTDSSGSRTKLTFYFRDSAPLITAPYSLSSAREHGSQGDVHALVTRGSRRDLPQEFVLEYINSDRDFQVGTTSYSITTASTRNTQKVTVPVVFSPQNADIKARQLLWRSIYEHDNIQGVLPPSMFALQPGDRLEFTATSANPIVSRVASSTVGENGLVDFQGLIDDELADQQAPGGDDPPPLVTIPPVPQYVSVFVLDIAPLSTAEASTFGVQVYVAGGNGPSFPSTVVYLSRDLIEWTPVATFSSPAVIGQAETVLGDASGHFWDTANTVEIRLRDDSVLFDESEEQVASGLNWAVLGSEIIGFTTTTLIEPGLYELSGLLRARNDTAGSTMNHFVDEPFTMLPPTGPNVVFHEVPTGLFHVDAWLRAVPAGTTIADNENSDYEFKAKARTLQPYRVHGAWATRSPDSEDLCLFVTDRTRVPYRLFSALAAPQVEEGDAEDFVAEVYWDSDPAPGRLWELVRTMTGCRQADGQISFHYSRNNQITDFHVSGRITDGSFPDQYRFLIYRKSDTIGEGRVLEFCANGYGFMANSDCSEA